MAKAKDGRKHGVDPHWPEVPDGEHPVSELAADRQGALSPYGDVTFPLDSVPYVHPETTINRD
ncbi:hypothetical protein [Amycolatopsis suaedae]|uniref:Uncharacterized protein n=1 Tax=Amycolatopsis suaedae TaxID=2510978 RepID=A0A4Q7J508_9PSEU|nr:hypothetical protein [Amycolatopsis suaedae]RZQ61806.1 hypothetical protein EWH70_22940 [Amycolatopsis suaedae]